MLPLEGIKVLEVAEYLAVPAAGAVLADWGAEVIKVERPGTGDRMRGLMATGVVPLSEINYAFELGNRNKKSIALEITKERGREILYKLVERSDIFLTNFLTSAQNKLKIGYGNLAEINPRLIYVQVNGYGQRGAENEKQGFDYSAFWARAAFAASTGEPDSPPPLQLPGVGDQTTGMFTAGAAAVMLFNREKTGRGGLVDLSLLGSGMWVNACAILAGIHSPLGFPRIARAGASNPLWNVYQTKEGKWVQLVMMATDLFWEGFCKAIGRKDFLDDRRFDSHVSRCQNNKELIILLDQVFATKAIDEWAKLLNENGCIWVKVQEVRDLASDSQALANERFLDVEHPTYGPFKVIASPARFNDLTPQVSARAPELGQHTEEVLLDIGFSWEDLVSFKDKGVII